MENIIEIKGNVSTAICYAKVIEQSAVDQIKRMCDYEFTQNSKIRIMPDVHSGAGCTIGTTMTVVDKAVPNIVGVDIGCGMYTVNLGKIKIDMGALDAICHYIPSGMDVWSGRMAPFDLTGLKCYRQLRNAGRLQRSLGTLGGGNHFIEIDRAEDDTKYLVIHSGSRNLGKQVAEYYQNLAVDLNLGIGEYLQARKSLIEQYKSEGRKGEIAAALSHLKWQHVKQETSIPKDLCYLYGEYLQDYLHDIDICQQFAKKNRELIAEIIIKKLKLKPIEAFHTIHNYIDIDTMILRKGAISAQKSEKLLIPINMRDGSILAYGKGNAEWNYSAPHGAGRIMSRMRAKNELSVEQYKKTMEGIYTTSVSKDTIDEAPMAYKSIDDIIGVIDETVDIIEILKPIYNFKAS